MGVRGLWEVLQPASTQESIEDYFMREGIVRRQRGERVYRLGIDTSIWFHQVQNTFAVGHAQSGENPELRTLFYRLARLLRLHVHAIFVFDGPDRPAEKRGRRVVPAGHWMVEAMKGFIDAFGYAYWTAPGEAEAELALFNQAGFIDGVLTDDGDAFLFGARTVIRNFDAKATTLTITRAESVLTHNAVSLSRPGMILFALLSGGDYDEGGLPGFGPRVALGLARYQFGETLCQAVRMHWHGDLSQVLSDWRNNMRQTLCSDPQNLLGRRYHRLSTQIPDTFPNPDIIDSYIHPVTSPYEDFEVPPLQPPNIARLGALCERYFSWGTVPGIIERFGNCVLPGVVVRVLINQTVKHDELCVTKDTYEDPLEPLIQVDRDSRRRRGARTIAVVDTGFAAAATSALLGLRPVDDNHPRPASLHYVVLPKLLIPFVWDSDRETTTRGKVTTSTQPTSSRNARPSQALARTRQSRRTAATMSDSNVTRTLSGGQTNSSSSCAKELHGDSDHSTGPDLKIFPLSHPYRRGVSSQDVTQYGRQAAPPLLQMNKSSAALPQTVAIGVQVERMDGVKASSVKAKGAVRSKGHPQSAESKDLGREDSTGDNGMQVSHSLTEKGLAILADSSRQHSSHCIHAVIDLTLSDEEMSVPIPGRTDVIEISSDEELH